MRRGLVNPQSYCCISLRAIRCCYHSWRKIEAIYQKRCSHLYVRCRNVSHLFIICLAAQKLHTIRPLDFHPYHVTLDPFTSIFSPHAHKVSIDYTSPFPTIISRAIPLPTVLHAKNYPDASERAETHDNELLPLD